MKEKIKAMLEKEFPEIEFSEDIDLVDDGILDSLSLSAVISILTMEFDITIPKEEIISDNFNSVDAMTAMVERLMGV